MIVLGAGLVLIPNFPLLKVMYLSQVGNGILLPVVLVFMLKLINDPEITGEYVNSKTANIIAWATVTIVSVLTLVMVVFLLFKIQ
jgi:Mn2+/Fe2+ NRAMP family transporter